METIADKLEERIKKCFARQPKQELPTLNLDYASNKATEAIKVFVDFRSAVHRWKAGGYSDEELAREVDRLEDTGLMDWYDEIITRSM